MMELRIDLCESAKLAEDDGGGGGGGGGCVKAVCRQWGQWAVYIYIVCVCRGTSSYVPEVNLHVVAHLQTEKLAWRCRAWLVPRSPCIDPCVLVGTGRGALY